MNIANIVKNKYKSDNKQQITQKDSRKDFTAGYPKKNLNFETFLKTQKTSNSFRFDLKISSIIVF